VVRRSPPLTGLFAHDTPYFARPVIVSVIAQRVAAERLEVSNAA
jgi:hypothetical protein